MSPGRGLTRITIVEDHRLFAEALDIALSLEGHEVHRVEIDDHPPGPHRLLAAVLRSQPRVVLLDLHLGGVRQGPELVRPLAQSGIAVVVVTGSVDRATWGECVYNGARTVLSKSTPLNGILSTIRLIGEGRSVLPYQERERLLATFLEQRAKENGARTRLATLTTRERQILRELMAGHQVREIATGFVVSEATVRTQVKSILSKLEVSSQLAAVGLAFRARA